MDPSISSVTYGGSYQHEIYLKYFMEEKKGKGEEQMVVEKN